MSMISVRDVARHIHHEMAPGERMLRVPYDLFNPVGPVTLRDGLITYLQAGESHTGSTAEATLADGHPGERVLLRFQDGTSESDEWWLCQIENPPPFV
jgi:hypothetical protein